MKLYQSCIKYIPKVQHSDSSWFQDICCAITSWDCLWFSWARVTCLEQLNNNYNMFWKICTRKKTIKISQLGSCTKRICVFISCKTGRLVRKNLLFQHYLEGPWYIAQKSGESGDEVSVLGAPKLDLTDSNGNKRPSASQKIASSTPFVRPVYFLLPSKWLHQIETSTSL